MLTKEIMDKFAAQVASNVRNPIKFSHIQCKTVQKHECVYPPLHHVLLLSSPFKYPAGSSVIFAFWEEIRKSDYFFYNGGR